jgi:hypothetical protein
MEMGAVRYAHLPTDRDHGGQAKHWIRLLAKVFKIQIAGIIVPRHDDDRPHLHVLMIGNSASGKTLNDVPAWIMKQAWERLYNFWKPANLTGRADAQLPRSNNAVSLYTEGNMKTWESTADLFESNSSDPGATMSMSSHLQPPSAQEGQDHRVATIV